MFGFFVGKIVMMVLCTVVNEGIGSSSIAKWEVGTFPESWGLIDVDLQYESAIGDDLIPGLLE